MRSPVMTSSMSHHRFARHCVTQVPPTRGLPPPGGCRDAAPVLTRCCSPQQRPTGLGSHRTHRRAEQHRRAAQQCRRVASKVREILELCRVDLERSRVRSRWQQDWVAVIRKSLRIGRVAATGSTLRSLPDSLELSSWEDGVGVHLGTPAKSLEETSHQDICMRTSTALTCALGVTPVTDVQKLDRPLLVTLVATRDLLLIPRNVLSLFLVSTRTTLDQTFPLSLVSACEDLDRQRSTLLSLLLSECRACTNRCQWRLELWKVSSARGTGLSAHIFSTGCRLADLWTDHPSEP